MSIFNCLLLVAFGNFGSFLYGFLGFYSKVVKINNSICSKNLPCRYKLKNGIRFYF